MSCPSDPRYRVSTGGIAVCATLVVLVRVLTAGLTVSSLTVGGVTIEGFALGGIDASVILAVLVPAYALYGGRRFTDAWHSVHGEGAG